MFRIYVALLLAATVLHAQQMETAPQVSQKVSAGEVLIRTAQILSSAEAVRYNVERIAAHPNSPDDSIDPGTTTILAATNEPPRFEARFHSDAGILEYAVSDGQLTRTSDQGKLSEGPARAMLDRPSEDALPSLGAFDTKTYRGVAESTLYAGDDDVEGDLCHVIALTSVSPDGIGSKTTFFWISAKSGLPRSLQSFRIIEGRTVVTYRWVFSDIALLAKIPVRAFSRVPTEADSVPTSGMQQSSPRVVLADSVPKKVALAGPTAGMLLPNFDLLTMDGRKVQLASLLHGESAIVTLWATWCAPCVTEMPLLQSEAGRHSGKLQVIAIAVQDSRLNVIEFIRKHPELHVVFVTDPDIANDNSALNRFFVGESVPRNTIIDPRRIVTDYRVAPYRGENELSRLITQSLASALTDP